jgi:DNA-binding Lrp family transcriptional regulator
VAYATAPSASELASLAERVREVPGVARLDARVCKRIPGDEDLSEPSPSMPEQAVLLINVDYAAEKERVVTWKLREIPQIALARAMWGPSDIIAIVEESDHESMRDLICDGIKVIKGVASNTTLYCYPV